MENDNIWRKVSFSFGNYSSAIRVIWKLNEGWTTNACNVNTWCGGLWRTETCINYTNVIIFRRAVQVVRRGETTILLKCDNYSRRKFSAATCAIVLKARRVRDSRLKLKKFWSSAMTVRFLISISAMLITIIIYLDESTL